MSILLYNSNRPDRNDSVSRQYKIDGQQQIKLHEKNRQ